MKYFISILYVLKEGIKENRIEILRFVLFMGFSLIFIGIIILMAGTASGETFIGNSNDYLIK
jgi:hypothetical protein